jgi:hypothetical protein
MSRQPHTRHHIELPVALPDIIRGLEEIRGLEDARIADDDIGLR